MRAAFQHLPGNADFRLARIVAARLRAAARILRHAAGLGRIGRVAGRPEVHGPLPHIADHVENPIAVRRVRHDRRGALVAVQRQVLERKRPLPGVGHLFSARREFLAPGVFGAIEAAARRELPLGLGRQFLARPARISLRIAVGHVHDRMIVEPADRAARPIGPPPIGAELEPPPLRPIFQIDWPIGRREDERSRLQHVRQRARIVLRIRRDLGERDMVRGVDELAELAVRDRCAIDPEGADADAVYRRLFRIMPVRTHAEFPARHEDHVGERVLAPRLDAFGNLAL